MGLIKQNNNVRYFTFKERQLHPCECHGIDFPRGTSKGSSNLNRVAGASVCVCGVRLDIDVELEKLESISWCI